MRARKERAFPGYSFVRSAFGIGEYRLVSNDLRVLAFPEHSTPIAACMVTYHVGSRNEAVGHTGSTHILEHLLFKGSKNFPGKGPRNIWDLIQSKGALMNATTWLDRTNYYEVVPREHLETVIALEADRMRHATFSASDLASEMTVVRNEFERGENNPLEVLDTNIWATAYQAHPYHHSTIGWRSDIENADVERLRAFYDAFYWPNNATVSVIGDIGTRDTLALVRKYFGVHPRSPRPIRDIHTEEPEQDGPRTVTVRRPGNTRLVGVAHKTPRGTSSDTPALAVLSSIIADGKTSRLYRRLVDGGKASLVSVMYHPLRDPGLFTAYCYPLKHIPFGEVEHAIGEEIAAIASGKVSASDLAAAREKCETAAASARDGAYAVASSLNEAIALGDWRYFFEFPKRVAAVSAADVSRVAAAYFTEAKRTTGYFDIA